MPLSRQIFGQAKTSSASPTATNAKANPAQKPNSAAAGLSAIVASGRLDDLRWPDFSDYRLHLTNFYRPVG
jgi:L,D-transpeptidase YcbB